MNLHFFASLFQTLIDDASASLVDPQHKAEARAASQLLGIAANVPLDHPNAATAGTLVSKALPVLQKFLDGTFPVQATVIDAGAALILSAVPELLTLARPAPTQVPVLRAVVDSDPPEQV